MPASSLPPRAKARALVHLFKTTSLGAPENAIGFVLWRVVHRYQREADRALSDLDLTHLQFVTLTMAAWLGREGGAVTQADIARSADIQPMQVSHMLKTLEDKQLVTRARSTTDVRAKHIEVTTTGLAALRRALPTMIALQRRLFGAAGTVGGSLLATLLRLDGEQTDKASRTF